MDEDVLAIIGIFFVTPALAFGYAAFRLWINKRAAIAPMTLTPALADRFDQLERQLETLSVEVERMAEGQRFVSKVLVERGPTPAALADGSAVAHALPDARRAPIAADAARHPEDR
jgi:hypothetical protein